MMRDVFVGIVAVSFVCVGLVFLLKVGMNGFSKNQVRQACNVFSVESKRETKFVEYTYWNFDCLTPQSDGKWVSAFNLRGE